MTTTKTQGADLSPGARSRWVRVVKHNQLDLEGMEHVLKTLVAASA